MAIGLIPHYSVDFTVEGLNNKEFLVIINEVANKLDWKISQIDAGGMTAYTKFKRGPVNEKIQLTVIDGLVTIKSESLGGQLYDRGKNKKNINEFISCYDELRSSISKEELDAKTSAVYEYPAIILENDQSDSSKSLQAGERTKGIWSIFIPVKGYYITPLIIDINILVFLLMTISGVNIMLPTSENLLHWGANFRPVTLDGQPWRLITNCFLHIGIFHILFNMYALLFIGILLEPLMGSWRFGIAYMVTGVMGSVASLYIHAMTISAGASGAIFGMYGVFLAMLTTNLIEKTRRKALLTSIAIFVGYNLLNGLKGGIDNAAHIGGLISGILIGYSFYPGLIHAKDRRLNYALPAILIIALIGFSSWEYRQIPNDVVKYDDQMKTFFSREISSLEVFKLPKSTPKDTLLFDLKERGIDYWTENKNLVVTLEKLDLPVEIHKRNKKLIQYCDFRIGSFDLFYKTIDEGTDKYNDGIRAYNYSIDSLIKTLK